MRRPLLLLLPFALIALACSRTPAPSPADVQPSATDAADALPDAAPADHAATLGAYHWDLTGATTGAGARIDALLDDAGKPLRLDFSDGGVSVSNACNRMRGTATLDGDRLEVGRVVSTMMACDDRLMTLEREIGQRLPGPHTLAIVPGDRPRLTLTSGDGEVLAFTGVATADTRYGGPGERVFLEVAPQRVACTPQAPEPTCLEVREIVFGDDGVRQSAGEWRPLAQDIEGYTHEPGVRNVLRLQRYPVTDPAADAPASAYVLDMVVESETVAR
ncbi:META and DUF4377 domain-containing protein [Luteimonas sp. BDR2-5]|uniref:META and DUF4377 domain-containing protein n=1 Tax=Proluteimonas luteida TaxID=2878685 RepID=UPI001E5A2F5F|nr:META and DUF4377 domain-containing protein [Luteimonas sp. BDR2-5]MCD9028038.1 META and DUF4377 domain-containing protein [Luteimonas sp. BDR2-5]